MQAQRVLTTSLFCLGCAVFVPAARSQGILYDIAPRRPTTDVVRASNRLVLEEERISGDVTEAHARYKIVERFRNPNAQPIEGVYLCPIPRGATARGLALVVDGKRMNGEILDSQKAGDVYRDIVRRMRDPALLEHVGDGLLRASVFPVPANGCVDVEIDLEAPIDDVGSGLLEIALPLKQVAEARAHLEIDLALTTDRHLDTVYSPTHPTKLTRNGDTHARIQFEGIVDSPSDFRLYFASDSTKGALRIVSNRLEGRDGYFQLMCEAPDDIASGAARDVVFVLDRSGSMQGEKWEQAVRAMAFGIRSLRQGDRFALLSFATDVRAFTDTLAIASDANKKAAIEHLNALQAAGGTDISSALGRAMPYLEAKPDRLPMVVFVTDGLPTVGEVDATRILDATTKGNLAKARLFTFGVGYDVNTVLLDRLAEDNAAESDYVAPQQDLEIPLSAFFAKVSEPAIVGPRLAVEGAGIEFFDVEPARLKDLFVGDTLRVVGRFRGVGKAKVTLTGTHGGKPVVLQREIGFEAANAKNDHLPGQWASRRIGHLLNEIRLHGQTKELVDAVTALGTEFGIVTPYTSGLVVADGVERGGDRPAASTSGDRGNGPATGGGRRAPGDRDDGLTSLRAGSAAKPLAPGSTDAGTARAKVSGEQAVHDAVELKKLEKGDIGARRLADLEGSTRKVGTRTFKKSAGTWTDSQFAESMRKEMHEIVAFSDEYFEFASAHKDLADVLALGDDLIVVVGDRAIRIRPNTGA